MGFYAINLLERKKERKTDEIFAANLSSDVSAAIQTPKKHAVRGHRKRWTGFETAIT